ncbi:hypothetical protein N335_05244, partial [Phaethon lepturus]
SQKDIYNTKKTLYIHIHTQREYIYIDIYKSVNLNSAFIKSI